MQAGARRQPCSAAVTCSIQGRAWILMPGLAGTRAPWRVSRISTQISASHLASRRSPTQYLPAKLPPQRLAGFCLHSTHCPDVHALFLRAAGLPSAVRRKEVGQA